MTNVLRQKCMSLSRRLILEATHRFLSCMCVASCNSCDKLVMLVTECHHAREHHHDRGQTDELSSISCSHTHASTYERTEYTHSIF